MARIVNTVGRRLPRGWGDASRQLGIFVLADLCYETVRGLAEGREALAFANAERIIALERATGTFFEAGVQGAVLEHRWLVELANWTYMNTHFVVTTAFLVWLYLFRNEAYYFVRNMFLVAMGLALIGYAAYPTAPPRLLPGEGFVDTITLYAGIGHDSALVKLFVNPYAAVPSMHIAFALMIAIPGVVIAKRLWVRALWAVYPLVVLAAIIVTANHFWLDAAAGALVAALAALAARTVLAGIRPADLRWRAEPREAAA